jgi:hypothetical protein
VLYEHFNNFILTCSYGLNLAFMLSADYALLKRLAFNVDYTVKSHLVLV